MTTYAEKLKNIRWQQKRLKILNRDGRKCQKCGAQNCYPDLPNYRPKRPIQVHHTKYVDKEPWDTPDEFLITLCDDCHLLEHLSPAMKTIFEFGKSKAI